MVKGLYTAASGMSSQQLQVDMIAGNLANANTTGYKRETMALKSFPQVLLRRFYDDHVMLGSKRGGEADLDPLASLAHDFPASQIQNSFSPNQKADHPDFMDMKSHPTRPFGQAVDLAPSIGWISSGSIVDEIRTFHAQGDLVETAKPLDLALFGTGFFKVSTPEGIRYTRNGNFTMNALGELVSHGGHRVLSDQDLPIVLNTRQEVSVTREGFVYSGQTQMAKLALVDFEDYKTAIAKEGDSLYRKITPGVPETAPLNLTVQQGFLEQANVNIVDSMVGLIAAMRTYEGSQKVIQQADDTIGRALEVGRPV